MKGGKREGSGRKKLNREQTSVFLEKDMKENLKKEIMEKYVSLSDKINYLIKEYFGRKK